MTESVDIFSMGFVYYSILAGGLPFGNTNDSRVAFMEETGGIPDLDPSWHSGFVGVSFLRCLNTPNPNPSPTLT